VSVTALIVQARMGSTRVPGKVMLRIGGRTILDYVLTRCAKVPGVDVVVCATVDHADCDPIAAEAMRLGAVVFRGSEEDVLGRYVGAARSVDATTVMRVTSDCPLIDPGVCGAVLRLRAANNADYACNNMPPSWPHGLDCEAFIMDALVRADAAARAPAEREHLTRIMRTQPDWSRVSLLGPGGEWETMRLTLDTPADLAFFEGLIPRLDDPDNAGLTDIADVLRADRRLHDLLVGQELHHGIRREAPTVVYTEFLPAL
jgi:spore coat polysaccharide biosynthesis protein SpsF (cytidylyltransferase family)